VSLSIRYIALGFLAGAVAVPLCHQSMVYLLFLAKQIPNHPWNLAPMKGPFPVPVLVNQMFWGGLWGAGFAGFGYLIPVAGTALRGLIYGLLGPFLLGNGVLVPLFKGVGPYVWSWPLPRYVVGGLIGAAFGLGLAMILRFISKR
jgi:hypothetical protein